MANGILRCQNYYLLLLISNPASAVQMNDSMGEWFKTAGVRKGCFLSPTLSNMFLERIMSEAQEEHDGKVSISRNIIDLQFADDIDGVAKEEQE